MTHTNRINETLKRINEAVVTYIKHEEDHGLLSGYCGSALFYTYYYKLTGKKKYLDNLKFVITRCTEALADKEIMYSHCSGISGIAWCISHLKNHEFIEQAGIENIFDEIDEVLFDIMMHELGNHYYDFLHEGLGIMLYFLDKLPDENAQGYLEAALGQLEKAAVTSVAGISWKDNFTRRNRDNEVSAIYNLGLAHGVPAILSILSILYEKGVAVDRVLPLVENGVKWLLSNKNDSRNDNISLYPSIVIDGDKEPGSRQSRLGWCYGDLGIAVTLCNIGTRLQNEYYRKEANLTFEYTLKNRNKRNGNIVDASLCHGSAGVSHIYRRAYLATSDDSFLKGAEQWLQITLQLADWKNCSTGFKYSTAIGYENNYSLLEGITGIGLALIAALDAANAPAWDRCLLLS